MANEKDAAASLRGAEDAATKSTEDSGSEERPRGLYRQENISEKVAGAGKIKKKAPLVAIGLILLLVLALFAPELPRLAIGAIKENLTDSLGFKDTVAILEEQGEYVVSENLAKGRMPSILAQDFLAKGMEVGQVTLAGEFVRTNTYIAELGSPVAAEGEYQASGEGELAIRFNGEIITADNFVAKVESDPTLYAAYSEAADISARYYYSDAVNDVYNNMGLSRGSFNNWDATGNAEKDQKSFKETLDKTIDKESNRNMSGKYTYWNWECVAWNEDGSCARYDWVPYDVEWVCSGGGSSWKCTRVSSFAPLNTTRSYSGDSKDVASGIVSWVSENCRRDNDTGITPEQNAAQILNTVLSADEPYRAASDFLALMEALERAQIDGDGPVNEMMNILSRPNEVTYLDVNTGQLVTDNKSILETHNFQMAVGNNKDYSKTEAENLSRDRILKVSDTVNKNSIETMPLSTDGKKKSGDGRIMNNSTPGDNTPASLSNLAQVTDAMKIGMADKNSELFATTLGANRILEGGSFVSNTINQQVIGSMPSDAAQVALYKQEVNTVLARQAEAERATKSPFDISSPNTFMGNLVRKLAVTMLNNRAMTSGSWLTQVTSTMGKLASSSVKSIASGVIADGNENEFTSVLGECLVVSTTDATCDLYGTSHNTVYTGHMDYREEDWKSVLSESEVEKFVEEGMKRDATVGVQSYEVCDASKSGGASASGLWGTIKGFLSKVVAVIKKLIMVVTGAVELDNGCNGVESDVATGSKYILYGGEDDKTAKLSGYALYSAVSSLLEDGNAVSE